MNMTSIRPGFMAGTLLIVFGTLLFLDNLGLLPVSVFGAFWPLLFIAVGVRGLTHSCSQTVRVWSVAAIVAGGLLVLDAFHILKVTGETLWPLALIATGVSMLVARTHRFDFVSRFNLAANSDTRPLTNSVSEIAVMSAIKRRIESQSFEGGDLTSAFGAIELDLRNAGISNHGRIAIVEASAAFGSIELRIPETWRISIQGTAVFGAYEDKTIPPRPEPGVETPTLVIKGGTAFGAVTIKN